MGQILTENLPEYYTTPREWSRYYSVGVQFSNRDVACLVALHSPSRRPVNRKASLEPVAELFRRTLIFAWNLHGANCQWRPCQKNSSRAEICRDIIQSQTRLLFEKVLGATCQRKGWTPPKCLQTGCDITLGKCPFQGATCSARNPSALSQEMHS